MRSGFKIAVAQLNPWIGDFVGNQNKIIKAIDQAVADKVQLLLLPELITCGYPPRDLLETNAFIEKNLSVVGAVERHCLNKAKNLVVVLGYVRPRQQEAGKKIANSALWIINGKVAGSVDKRLLPTYDVFDENRYFEPGTAAGHFEMLGCRIGVTICEDLWDMSQSDGVPNYLSHPLADLQAAKCDLVVNLSASPYALGKPQRRRQLFVEQAKRYQIPIVMVNQVGANDDLIFDGHSFAIDAKGACCLQAHGFVEQQSILTLHPDGAMQPLHSQPAMLQDEAQLWQALQLGLADYFRKLNLKKAVIGISGGVDSALVATLAVQTLGAENVVGIMMPSRFTSQQSLDDAAKLAKNLGMELQTISIEPIFSAYLNQLRPLFLDHAWDTTEENLQARIRGALLMAYANKFGHLLLSTGNKSELAVGYCTLYGDLTGGLAVISDLYKTQIYRLCVHLNHAQEIIPRSILQRPPSAELKANQQDQDSLPPYEVLDAILELYIEQQLDAATITQKLGQSPRVSDILRRVDRNEFKRRQMPLGLKVSPRAFGQGRRLPIAAYMPQLS